MCVRACVCTTLVGSWLVSFTLLPPYPRYVLVRSLVVTQSRSGHAPTCPQSVTLLIEMYMSSCAVDGYWRKYLLWSSMIRVNTEPCYWTFPWPSIPLHVLKFILILPFCHCCSLPDCSEVSIRLTYHNFVRVSWFSHHIVISLTALTRREYYKPWRFRSSCFPYHLIFIYLQFQGGTASYNRVFVELSVLIRRQVLAVSKLISTVQWLKEMFTA